MSGRVAMEINQKVTTPDEEKQHSKLMKSFQSLLSGELGFMFPTMAGISMTDSLDKEAQGMVCLIFLMIGFISMISWIWSHTTEASKWTHLVSALTQFVTICCLGLFHFATGLLMPSEYEVWVLANILLFALGSLLMLWQWKFSFPIPNTKEALKKD